MTFTKVEVMEGPNWPMMGPGIWNPEHLYILFMTEGDAYLFTKAGWAPWKSGRTIREVLEEYNG